jgi:PEP-CTERM motif
MKNHLLMAGLALAAALTVPQAHATVSANPGDLILAFRTNDGAVQDDLEVDLGPFSQFTGLAAGTVLNLNLNGTYYGTTRGLSAADLQTVFPGWNTLTDLVWSVAGQTGAGASSKDLYATFTPADGATVSQKAGSVQNTAAARLSTLQGGLDGFDSLASPQAAEVPVSLTSNGNYSGAIRGTGATTKDYAYFTPSTEALVNDSGDSTLDLFQEIHGGSGAGTDLGTFDLNNSGTFTFTAASAVPEPSTYAAVLMGGAVLLLAGRRRKP